MFILKYKYLKTFVTQNISTIINGIFVYEYTWFFIPKYFELLKDNESSLQRKSHLHLFLCYVFSVQFNIFLFT